MIILIVVKVWSSGGSVLSNGPWVARSRVLTKDNHDYFQNSQFIIISIIIIILTETGLTRMFLTWPTSTGLSWDTMNQTRLTRQTWHQKRQHMDGLSCRKNIQIRFLSIIIQIRFLSLDIIIKILKLCKPTLITISTMYSFKTLVSPACSGINTDWMDEFMQVSYSMPTFPRKKFSHFILVILVLIVESWCRYVKSLAAESTTLQPIRILEVENHFDLNWSSPSR